MAKILGPLHSISAAGSFGPRLTFSNRKSGQQVRIQKAQVYTPNTAQQTAREAYAAAYAGWNDLSDEEKQEYKDRAGATMTGYNLYMKENIGVSAFVAKGGTITDAGEYRYHTFTENGVFEIGVASLSIEFVIIAGGAGGGGGGYNGYGGGGGGAGGMKEDTETLTKNTYDIVIGAGGNGGNNTQKGFDGENSTFNGVTAHGGGGGGKGPDALSGGNNGGSGGGAAGNNSSLTYGSGTSGEGNNGANGSFQTGLGGGGGGKTGAASNATGGAGKTSTYSGTETVFCIGGAGGKIGGAASNGASASANTGNGGGGAEGSSTPGGGGTGGNGGSGRVVVRYLIP